ncbi:MAG: protein jag [Deltaproteobacteria bacterium]|nr:MAG: protein jag [Deltaproteobacteria bacterium]
MPKAVETQGVTVEEAIQVALNRLGVSRDRVEIEILHHPRSGLFGIGARRAKIRATLRDQRFADGEEFEIGGGRRRGRRGRRRRGGSGERAAEAGGGQKSQKRTSADRGGDKSSGRSSRGRGGKSRPAERSQRDSGIVEGKRPEDGAEPAIVVEDEAIAVVEAADRGSDAQPVEETVAAVQSAQAAQEDAKEPLTAEQVGSRALELVDELLRRMGFEATVELGAGDFPGEVLVQIHCDADGLLIGRHGQTLDSVEHLVNRMVLAGESSDLRVILDVGGYRQRRRDTLLELADRLKVRALTQGRKVQVSPMSPRDRRIFQGALARDDTVTTQVMGSGFYRRVMIVPVGLEDDEQPAEQVGHEDTREAGHSGESDGRG